MAQSALVVDDSMTMRNMISVALKKLKFDVIMAKDGVDALEKSGHHHADIIITDINMPNMDGIELIRMLREQPKTQYTHILVISTESSDNVKQAGKSAGASGWITKPVQPEVLHRAVSKLCGIQS